MGRHFAVVVILVLSAASAAADAPADATKALTTFIEGVAANKAALTGVDVFIPVDESDTNVSDGTADPLPSAPGDTGKLIASTKLKVTKAVVSKSGTSAWIAGEVSGKVP